MQFRLETNVNSKSAHPFDSEQALGAGGSQMSLVAVLAVQLSPLFHESDVDERTVAPVVGTDEVVRTPRLAESQHERTSATTT